MTFTTCSPKILETKLKTLVEFYEKGKETLGESSKWIEIKTLMVYLN
jgi:hypothetical protein